MQVEKKCISHTFSPDSRYSKKSDQVLAPTCKAFRLPRRSVRTQNQPARYSKDAKHPCAFAHSTRLFSPNCFKRSEQPSNCRQMQGFDTVISPESPLNMPAKVEEVYSFCRLRSSAKGRGEGCKKGGGGALCNFANRQFIHSKRAGEIRTKHKGGWGEKGGGEIQHQQKLSSLCNNLTHKNTLKPRRSHQQSLLICQEGTGSFCPPFSSLRQEQRRGCKDNFVHFATSCNQTCKHASFPTLSPPQSARCCPYLGRTPHSLPTASQPQPHSSAETSVASDIKKKKVQTRHSASPFSSLKVTRREIVLMVSEQLTLKRRPKGGGEKIH